MHNTAKCFKCSSISYRVYAIGQEVADVGREFSVSSDILGPHNLEDEGNRIPQCQEPLAQ
jgi:hypothetical protein